MKRIQCYNKAKNWRCEYYYTECGYATCDCEDFTFGFYIDKNKQIHTWYIPCVIPLKYIRCCPHANNGKGGHDKESLFGYFEIDLKK